jgi:hypothetical protein
MAMIGGLGIGSWYYSERIETLKEQMNTKEAQLGRYRVALGIDKASRGNLIELTNDELTTKSIATVGKLRSVCLSVRKRDENAVKEETRLSAREKNKRALARLQEASDEVDKTVRSDTVLVDNELRRRLDPRAIAAIPGLSPSTYDAATGTPVDTLSLVGGFGIADATCFIADGIEQMAKLLPSDGKH